jgi:thioredoxin reductase
MRTPMVGFFAVGDVREEPARRAMSAAADGATAALAAEHFLIECYGPPALN